MFKKSLMLIIAFSLCLPFISLADEGMWIPLLLNKRENDMQEKGMKISAKDIYDINNSSLKDAVMLFGGGCTGEFVSNEGLLLTNHHCGYGHIVRQSTVGKDYLTNGFWAFSKQEELPCKGLSIVQLIYMKDVSKKILEGVTNNLSENQRKEIIEKNTKEVIEDATKDNHYQAEVKPLYYGNQYFLYVNEVFTDIRLVGAPPSNIGKFGGDSDNWMWPRHTGDFAMFRVYVGKDNKPAEYSKDNIPFTPKKFLKINLKGLNEGDFTFVFGYPGTTQQFLTSHAVDRIANFDNPARIKLRNVRINTYKDAMNQSPEQRLRYAAGVAGIANGWKKWTGEIKGLKRLKAVERKREFESNFNQWANITQERKDNYGELVNSFNKFYEEKAKIDMSYLYLVEAVLASDLMKNGRSILGIIDRAEKNNLSNKEIQVEADNLLLRLNSYFENDYSNHKKVDKAIFIDVMSIYYEDFAKTNSPWIKEKVESSFKGIPSDYFNYVYENSFLSSKKSAKKKLKKFKVKNILSDPAIELLSGIWGSVIEKDIPKLINIEQKLDSLYRIYVVGIMDMNSGKDFYPDANLSLRVAYGHIKPYKPRDGVNYKTHTTIKGIMEKENPDIYDYVVEKKLKELYNTKDYGRYANKEGEIPVAFIASNHTTGGNSGSPVLDANGNLVGINFDRNWEGTMSDIMYDPDQCRNISIDIRYCLFIIDKFAGAKNLIDELTIVE